MRLGALVGVAGALALLLVLPAAAPIAAPSVPAPRPRVTLISDSVAAAISFDTGARAILAEGVDLFLEPGQGRLLGGANPPDGILLPPTALQLIDVLGDRLVPTVIVCVGYNDVADDYAENMEAALVALRRAGVKHVLWATLHYTVAHNGYRTINNAIQAVAAQHPEVVVVDWDAHSSTHPEWFQQPDDVHLAGDGPRAMARLFHASLVRLGIPG